MSKGQKLRALVNERLTAAAEEIFELFERTIAEYEEEVHRFKQRNNTQQQLLDQVLEPRVLLHRTGVQFVSVKSEEEGGGSPEPPHIKEEPEAEQLQEFPPVSVKSGDDEDKSSVLHQRPTEENREETNGEDCGAEAGCSSDPLTHLHSDSEGWTQEKRTDSSERDVRGNTKKHRCPECGKRFQRKHHLQNHMLIHSGQKLFKCSVCQREFRRKDQLQAHIRTHTGEKPYVCSVCTKGFTQQGSLRAHMRTHSGEKPYSCSLCRKSYSQKKSLKTHLESHSGQCSFTWRAPGAPTGLRAPQAPQGLEEPGPGASWSLVSSGAEQYGSVSVWSVVD